MKGKLFSHLFSIIVASIVLLCAVSGEAALTSVNLTLPAPTTLSNGSAYYLSSSGARTYAFVITAVNPTATLASDYNYFELTIPTASAGDLVINYDPDGGTFTATLAAANVTADITVADAVAGTWSNPTITLTVTLDWALDAAIESAAALRTITAEVQEATILTTIQSSKVQTYGICSNVRVNSFDQTGAAADGFISPVHAAFNVIGTIVYDIPGYALENASDAVADADITSISLNLNSAPAVNRPGGANAAFSASVLLNSITDTGNHEWTAVVTAGGVTRNSANTLPLECNSVIVGTITFSGGVGLDIDAGPPAITTYYRGYGLTGTRVTLTADMAETAVTGSGMRGDTTFNIQYNNGGNTGNFTVVLPSGQTSVTADIPYDNATGLLNAWIPSESTLAFTYQVTTVTGGTCELNQPDDGAGGITADIKWDRADPPASGTPSIAGVTVSPSATTVRIKWTPVTMDNASNDRDFYEYRVYYRENGVGASYLQWDGDDDPQLRSLVNQEAPFDATHNFESISVKYTDIPGLKIFTVYDFYVTAVDIFGNEITETNAGPTNVADRDFRTQPYSIATTISDGITSSSDFTDLTPSLRQLRDSAIKIELTIVASEEQPDTVTVWVANQSTDGTDIISGNAINPALLVGTELFSFEATRTGPNKYTAFIPDSNILVAVGTEIRFIVESSLEGSSTFSDARTIGDTEDPNDEEWTFSVIATPTFTPWPTRILNNVMTKSSPTAYPSYYLSDNATVTIKVYDIKGRPVITLLDNAPRLGGQNIKDQGWSGTNKSGRKIGKGLYIIHIKARRTSDGKIILNKFNKVLMKR